MKKENAIISVFDTHVQAERAVKELQASGFDMKKLSIVGRGYHPEEKPVGFYTSGDRIKSWGGMGAFWGGLWGLLFGGFSALGAALISIGIPKDSIVKYERELKADKYLVIAHGDIQVVERARQIMDQVKATAQSTEELAV